MAMVVTALAAPLRPLTMSPLPLPLLLPLQLLLPLPLPLPLPLLLPLLLSVNEMMTFIQKIRNAFSSSFDSVRPAPVRQPVRVHPASAASFCQARTYTRGGRVPTRRALSSEKGGSPLAAERRLNGGHRGPGESQSSSSLMPLP